jgi:hypothetical protein
MDAGCVRMCMYVDMDMDIKSMSMSMSVNVRWAFRPLGSAGQTPSCPQG